MVGDRTTLGKQVESARIARDWSKEEAARQAGISAITWKRIEEGLNVHDGKLMAALRVLGLDTNGEETEVRTIGHTEQTGADLVSFEITGNFGVSAVVKGPIKDLDALQAAASKLIAGMQLEGDSKTQASP